MGMPAARANWTVEMLDALPEDGQRCVFSQRMEWQPHGMSAPLVLELQSLFDDALA
jgi:hypothetical protein